MVVANQYEINKRKNKIKQLEKGLNKDGSIPEKKLCNQIRSAIRKVWMKHPVKLAYLYKHTYPDTNPETRTKWLVDCELCGNAFKLSDIQVDHIHGENKLTKYKDVASFAKSILGVTEDDIRCLCISCHEGVTYAARYNMILEDAFKEKEVIKKLKQPIAKQKEELSKEGYSLSDTSNDTKRRNCYRELLKKKMLTNQK